MTQKPIIKIQGEYIPPGDKSISHRAAMLGALADGTSEFSHFLESEDCFRTIDAFRVMGATYKFKTSETQTGSRTTKLIVTGVGLNGLRAPESALYLGNSGTTMRLMLGILAGQSFETRLTGDPSLSARPMKRVTEPLRKMGAEISGKDDANFAPLAIRGGELSGIQWTNQFASAQVKSALLLAGLYAQGSTRVTEPLPTRDHTERLLRLLGVPVEASKSGVAVRRVSTLHPIHMRIPGDFSSAAFFIAAALIVPHSDLRVLDVGLNPSRMGFYHVLKQMGADIKIERQDHGEEPIGDLRVKTSSLKGIDLDPRMVPLLIDELPILMVLCALAQGTTRIRGARELRVKETDRLRSMTEGLKTIGARIEECDDGCTIEGVREFASGSVSSYQDHRTAMSFLIAGLRAKGNVVVRDADCVKISYPDFEGDLKRICS